MGAQPGALIGPYRILDQIGQGGMGQVFTAVRESDGQKVALKVLLKEAAEDRQLVRRFDQEYSVLSGLRHPNIVEVIDWGKLEDGAAYLVMERLEGTSLREWLSSQGRPAEVKTALAIGRQIADAMSTAHERGIVHRDLKPDNIFVLSADPAAPAAPTVKVLDFGIAKVPASPTGGVDTQVLTAAGTVLGTLAYMAPEQCLNVEKVNDAADVYALGVMLFELLAGRLPFVAEEQVDFVTMHNRDHPPPLRELAPEAPEDLCVLIHSMLAKDSSERPSMRRCCVRFKELEASERSECPLPGLQPFAEADAELFFGRRSDITTLVDWLKLARAGYQRWLLIDGPSGAGKSSLVQAGILPHLEDDRGPDGRRWLIGSMRPSDDPLRALAQALVDALSGHGLEQTLEEVHSELVKDPGALRSFVAHTPPGRTLLLVIEQMEELFTLGVRQEAFIDALLHAALTDRECPFLLLTTLRTDFYQCLDQTPKLADLLNKIVFMHHLAPMREVALKQVVEGMAVRAGLSLDESLSARMARDAIDTGCPLPLLGHALRALWSPRDGAPSSLLERYEQMGGVGGALSKQAEAFLKDLGDERRERAKWIILSLVQVNRGAPLARRSRSLAEALSAGGDDAPAEEVLKRLSGVRLGTSAAVGGELRLVVLSGRPGEDPSRQRVDLVHETLLREVPTIARWLNRERLRLEQYTDLESAAAIWDQTGRDPVDLPTGASLAHFRGSVEDERRIELRERFVSELALRYLTEAEEAERRRHLREQEEEKARQRQRTFERRMMVTVSIVAVIAIGLAVYAFLQSEIAEANLRRFISTTDEIISDIDWKLSRNAGNWKIRSRQLERIYNELQRLPASELDKAEVRIIVIKTQHRLGDFALSDGSLADAEKMYTKAREELKKNGERAAVNQQWAFYWALNDSKLGKVALAKNDLKKAKEYFDSALSGMLSVDGGKVDDIRSTATSYSEQAELELLLGLPEVALRLYDEAIKRFRDIKDEGNEDDDRKYNQSLLAEALGARAAAARRAEDLSSAKTWLMEAIAIEQPLAEDALSNAYHRSILARLDVELAELRLQQNNLDEAAERFEAARALGQALATGDPTRKPYALIWGDALRGLERVARQRNDHEGAMMLRDERYKLADRFVGAGGQDPEDVRFQHLRDL